MAGERWTSPRRIQAKLRQRQALELRLAERSYKEIAQALGYRHRSGAEMAVKGCPGGDHAGGRPRRSGGCM